jgi:hypothetical protein
MMMMMKKIGELSTKGIEASLPHLKMGLLSTYFKIAKFLLHSDTYQWSGVVYAGEIISVETTTWWSEEA